MSKRGHNDQFHEHLSFGVLAQTFLVWGDCGADRGVYGESVRGWDRNRVARVFGDGV